MPLRLERVADGWRAHDPDNPAIDVTRPERSAAIAAAQAALNEYEEAKRAPTPEAQPDRAETRRRPRKMKIHDGMLRSEEERWRLADTEGYEAMVERIAAIKAAAPALKVEHDFEKRFDLADCLVGLLQTYRRNKAQPPMKETLDDHERRLTEIRETGSLATATVLEKIWLAMEGYRLYRDPITNREKHDLQKAVRANLNSPRKEGGGGGYLSAEAKLARGLASTFHVGTGKGLATGTRGQLRGPYAKFAHECATLLGVPLKDSMIRDQAKKMREYFKERNR